MAIVVRNLESRAAGGCFDCTAQVTLDGRERPLTLRRHGDHPDLARRIDTLDPFAVALLVPAMLRGEPLVIEGDIDEILLGSLRGVVQHTLRVMAPAWSHVTVEAHARKSAAVTDWTKGAAAAMSGGIDSMHLARHRILRRDVPEPLRVRVLVHHHVGAHGDDDAVFAEQCAHARRIADGLGLPLVGVRCPLGEAFRGLKFIHSVTTRNVAASMALDHLFTAFHYASTEPVGERPKMNEVGGVSILDADLLPMFNTTSTAWLPFGGDTTRLRKTSEVLGEERLRGDLLVCMRGFRRDRANLNCGRCYKCARVLLQAEADGLLDAVSATFDMDGFRRGRTHSLVRLLRWSLGPRRNANEIDLLKYLHERRYPFPAWMRPGVGLALLLHGTRHSLAT
ncbi:MAG: hypothetical protein ACKOZU_07960 [Planctomycetaceae bacterium]